MSYKSYNERTVTLKLERRDVCRLMMACTLTSQIKDSSPVWAELHDKIMDQLHEFDLKKFRSSQPISRNARGSSPGIIPGMASGI